jgi:hypothetical protein
MVIALDMSTTEGAVEISSQKAASEALIRSSGLLL